MSDEARAKLIEGLYDLQHNTENVSDMDRAAALIAVLVTLCKKQENPQVAFDTVMAQLPEIWKQTSNVKL